MSDEGEDFIEQEEQPFEEDEEEDEEDEEDEEEEEEGTPSGEVQSKITYRRGDDRKTLNIMTPYEYARLIGIRAAQIEANHPVHYLVKDAETDDPIELAELEINHPDIDDFPLIIERPYDRVSNPRIIEVWKVRELMIPNALLVHKLNRIPDRWSIFSQVRL